LKNPLGRSVKKQADPSTPTATPTTTVDSPMSLREQLRRAHPTVDGLTYDVLTGKISEEEYRKRINED
jgi:hypothetical protein